MRRQVGALSENNVQTTQQNEVQKDDADHNGIVRMTQQITRSAGRASILVAGGTAGQSCGRPSPALNSANPEQESEHVSN
jgi:hypothetical protein